MNLSEEKLCEVYKLDECVEWLKKSDFRSTSLQFSRETLEFSSRICLYLKSKTQINFYISYSTMCCVDYLSAHHLNESTVDSIIFFGTVCLTSSQFLNSLPVFYVFPNNYPNEALDFIESSIIEMNSKNIIILYETSNTLMAFEVIEKIKQNVDFTGNISVAKLNSVSQKWNFNKSVSNAVQSLDTEKKDCPFILGPFALPNKIESYDLAVYLGCCQSLELILNSSTLLEIDPKNTTKKVFYANKELRKRVALIEKFKQKSCQSIGIVFTNPLPNVNQFFSEAKKFGKKLKKKVYLISLLQTIDEYKLANFSELMAFVVINSCFCSSARNSIDYCLPVLSWTEFEIASGVPKQYGAVQWNQSQDQQLSDEDETEIDDIANQLISTEVFQSNKWFGLEVTAGDREASLIKTGQKGIASGYQNEDVL